LGLHKNQEKEMIPKEPTPEECTSNAKVYEDEVRTGFAIWFPSMGGYVGKAVALSLKKYNRADFNKCMELYVWHNGEFPFDDKDGMGPKHIHICDPKQFINFGEKLYVLNGGGE
jgi:hypothetical protein